jgi:hypothetical protein
MKKILLICLVAVNMLQAQEVKTHTEQLGFFILDPLWIL